MLLAALLAALLAVIWAAVLQTNDPKIVGTYFFLTVTTCWAVLVPAKLWTQRVEDSWRRRVVMMGVAVVVVRHPVLGPKFLR